MMDVLPYLLVRGLDTHRTDELFLNLEFVHRYHFASLSMSSLGCVASLVSSSSVFPLRFGYCMAGMRWLPLSNVWNGCCPLLHWTRSPPLLVTRQVSSQRSQLYPPRSPEQRVGMLVMWRTLVCPRFCRISLAPSVSRRSQPCVTSGWLAQAEVKGLWKRIVVVYLCMDSCLRCCSLAVGGGGLAG